LQWESVETNSIPAIFPRQPILAKMSRRCSILLACCACWLIAGLPLAARGGDIGWTLPTVGQAPLLPLPLVPVGDCCPAACEEEDDSLRCFGPCCEVRKTLMQWSYGTSFSGGPPGYDEPLASDRPDFTEASVTVGRGVAQVEMGYTYFTDDEGGVERREHSYPEMLWRIGMFAEWFEFRIAYSHASGSSQVGQLPIENFSGGEDLYLGVKLGLTPQEGILPEMALVLQTTVPTGHGDVTAGITQPGFNWLYGWEVNDFIGIGGSTQMNRAVDDLDEVYLEFAQSFTINYALAEQLGAFTEWFVLVPSGSEVARTEHYLDGGFVYRVTNNLQLDVRAGIGLSQAAFDFFGGTGVVIRL
jgi:hypothetical protein